MAFKSGRLGAISIATKLLDTYTDNMDITIKQVNHDVTTFSAAWDAYIAGTAGLVLALSGSYDPTVTVAPSSVLLAQIALNQAGTATACIAYPAGNNAGQGTSHTFNALLSDFKETTNVKKQVVWSCTLTATGVDTIAQL